MIDTIWDTVEDFIEDWCNSPYAWQTEIDIQAEIVARLRQALKEHNQLLQKARYDYIRNGEMREYSRVCCELKAYYNLNGERDYCYPDIIVFDDILDPNNPPDAKLMKNWPMLWICEVKYQTEDNSPQYEEWDTEKIGYLLEQGETKFACSLYFKRNKIDKSLIKPIEEKNGRFRNYTILPKI